MSKKGNATENKENNPPLNSKKLNSNNAKPLSQDECFKRISFCLNKVDSVGVSYVEGEATELPLLPAIEVKDFGTIALPLCDQQAKALISRSQQAPIDRTRRFYKS